MIETSDVLKIMSPEMNETSFAPKLRHKVRNNGAQKVEAFKKRVEKRRKANKATRKAKRRK